MKKRADNAYNNLLTTVEGLDKQSFGFFQCFFDSLPEDECSVIKLEELLDSKKKELGLQDDILKFEKLVMFYIGFDQAIRSSVCVEQVK